MAYECEACGMSVGTMTCGKCGKPLEHSSIQDEAGNTVHVSKCPAGCGMIKSPQCCGQDMVAK